MGWLIFYVYAIFTAELHPGRIFSYPQPNDVVDTASCNHGSLPTCPKMGVCGFLQVNVKGVTQRKFCSCPLGMNCSMVWDEDDGKSITQGSDQYKFCDKAPVVVNCNSNTLAYTSRMLFQIPTEKILQRHEEINSQCPRRHYYVATHKVFNKPSNNTEAITISYACVKMPFCKFGQSCKTVTECGQEFLVNVKCRCRGHQNCPSLGNNLNKFWNMGNTRQVQLHCQQ